MRCDALQGHHHVGSFLAAFPFVNSNLFRPISVFCGLCRYAVATQAFPVPQQPFNLPQGGKICSRLCFREGQIYFFILPQGGSLRRNDEARRAGLSVRWVCIFRDGLGGKIRPLPARFSRRSNVWSQALHSKGMVSPITITTNTLTTTDIPITPFHPFTLTS